MINISHSMTYMIHIYTTSHHHIYKITSVQDVYLLCVCVVETGELILFPVVCLRLKMVGDFW